MSRGLHGCGETCNHLPHAVGIEPATYDRALVVDLSITCAKCMPNLCRVSNSGGELPRGLASYCP
eukprot:COSAG06_NODE_137_length_22365_cov_49.346313_25_plen_65_part_00